MNKRTLFSSCACLLLMLCAAFSADDSLPVTNGLALRYNACAITGLTNGQMADTWLDTSGNGNNGTKAGYGAYTGPHYYTNRQNSLPAVNFGIYGADIGEWFRFSSITPLQVFFVANDMRSSGTSQVMGQGGTYDWHNGGLSAVFANITGFAGHWIGKLNGTNISLTAQRWSLYQPFILSIQLPSDWARYTDRMCSDRDGYGGRAWGGDIFETLLYTEAVSDYDENAIGYYLQQKWSIPGAYVPPWVTVNNAGGATGLTSSAACLNGNLEFTGGKTTEVWIYWGSSDGGTTRTQWASWTNLGVCSTGAFTKLAAHLQLGSKYYYRCYATNTFAEGWATNSTVFNTLPSIGTTIVIR